MTYTKSIQSFTLRGEEKHKQISLAAAASSALTLAHCHRISLLPFNPPLIPPPSYARLRYFMTRAKRISTSRNFNITRRRRCRCHRQRGVEWMMCGNLIKRAHTHARTKSSSRTAQMRRAKFLSLPRSFTTSFQFSLALFDKFCFHPFPLAIELAKFRLFFHF
jgi:hypothetical protein